MKNLKKIVSVLLCAVLLLGIMPVVSFSAETTQLVLGEMTDMYIEEDYYATLTFTPSESAYYRIKSLGYDDVYVDCYDENDEWLEHDDDGGVGYNFNLPIYLEKGVTYSFKVGSYEYYGAETSVLLEKLSGKSMTKMTEDVEYSVNLDDSGESQWFSFTPKKDGFYAFYSEEAEDSFGYIYDSEWILVNKNDDAAEHLNFYVEAYLFEGETYYFEASKYDWYEEDSYSVKVEEVEVVEEINVTQMPYDTTCYKDYIDETLYLGGLELELVYTDGSVVEWSYDEYEESEIFGVEVDYDYLIDENDDAYVEVWTTYASTQFDVNDIENPVESIVVESMPEITLIEGVDGYYDWDGNFIYDYYIPEDVMIEVTYKDGSKETVGIWQTINGYGFDFYAYQGDGYTWEVGENYVTVDYFGVSTVLPVNVIENPVESIELLNAPVKEYVFGDEEHGFFYEEGEYCEYELLPFDLEGIELAVNYKDGTSEIVTDADVDVYDATINGYRYQVDFIFATEPGVYETTLYYLGHEVTYDVTILDGSYAPDYVLGDADGDSEVSVMDASLIQMFLVDKKTIEGDAILAADADCDGEISVMDASLIQMYLVGKKELG